MFVFCSSTCMRQIIAADADLRIPPLPIVIRFVPARAHRNTARRAMRDFTGFLTLAWMIAEFALWVGGA